MAITISGNEILIVRERAPQNAPVEPIEARMRAALLRAIGEKLADGREYRVRLYSLETLDNEWAYAPTPAEREYILRATVTPLG